MSELRIEKKMKRRNEEEKCKRKANEEGEWIYRLIRDQQPDVLKIIFREKDVEKKKKKEKLC